MILPIDDRPPEILRSLIEAAWALNPTLNNVSPAHQQAIAETVARVSSGHLRIAERTGDGWQTHAWLKQAILLFFKITGVTEMGSDPLHWVDKVPVKRFTPDLGVRVVPPAVVRFGAFVARGCVLMPCYVNIGAYVDEGTMVDTWATVGSCAQIGKNVHLSGGVGIGGVLEPALAQPVIIEDNCFVGSRAVIVEGVRICAGAVIGAGVILTASTPIVDVSGEKVVITKGLIPENRVVIPGTVAKKFAAGTFQVPCALIIGARSASTDKKTSLTQALREFEVSV